MNIENLGDLEELNDKLVEAQLIKGYIALIEAVVMHDLKPKNIDVTDADAFINHIAKVTNEIILDRHRGFQEIICDAVGNDLHEVHKMTMTFINEMKEEK